MDTAAKGVDARRRRVLTVATAVVGGAGIVGASVPFILAMKPSARSHAIGAPINVDVSKLESGQQLTVKWRGKPVWILRRDQQMLDTLQSVELRGRLQDPDSTVESQQPEYAQNIYRARRADYLVVVALCTHLGCVPSFRPDRAASDLGPEWPGGYFCPCHGSQFDLAGRVFKGVPAPTNLVVPPYYFLSDTLIRIGEDVEAA